MKHYFISAEQVKINIIKHTLLEKIFRYHHSNCVKDEKCQKGNWSCWKNVKKKKENGKKHRNSANTLSIHHLFRHAQVLHT